MREIKIGPGAAGRLSVSENPCLWSCIRTGLLPYGRRIPQPCLHRRLLAGLPWRHVLYCVLLHLYHACTWPAAQLSLEDNKVKAAKTPLGSTVMIVTERRWWVGWGGGEKRERKKSRTKNLEYSQQSCPSRAVTTRREEQTDTQHTHTLLRLASDRTGRAPGIRALEDTRRPRWMRWVFRIIHTSHGPLRMRNDSAGTDRSPMWTPHAAVSASCRDPA